MKKDNKEEHESEVFWRCAAEDNDPTAARSEGKERISLLIGSSGNRKQLANHLSQHYRVLLPEETVSDDGPSQENPADSTFDLAIVDISGAVRWRKALAEARNNAQPVFLPAMLITSQKELPRAMQACGAHVDEFLLAPIDPGELLQRVAMLLRARRQALTQSARLAYLINHDQGSGLPNQTLFLDRLSQAIQDGTVLDQRVYAMVIHVPLAPILKSLGNRALERAALACCRRLETILGEAYSLARLSTEKWALMLRAGASTDDAVEIFRRIQTLESSAISVDGERVHVSPAVGIAIYPDDASNASSLLDCAAAALARTKRISRPTFYSARVQRQALAHIRTEAGLREALAREQFELWFQPKVYLKDRSLYGVEALIRWRLPSGELVPPNNFIPVAESAGLVIEIDRWVLTKACECIRDWQSWIGPAQVAINISVQQLDTPDFVTIVEQTMARFGVAPAALELELTETTMADLGPENLDKLRALRRMGVSIALDDFGTGYCSLNYLHKLPISTLKIDKCFIDNIATDSSEAAITQTIVSLATNFRLRLVAEGIETEEQFDCLAALGVETGQGYLFARPMPLNQLKEWAQAAPAPRKAIRATIKG